jgi:hypothetical protein
VTGGAGNGANTTVSIGIGKFDPASNETVLRTAGETGINRQQSQQGSQSKSTAEVASPVPNDTTVGRLLELPVIHQMTNAAGQPVKLVRDTTGAVIEYTLDNTGKISDWRVVSKAPGDIPTSPQRLLDPPDFHQTTNAAGTTYAAGQAVAPDTTAGIEFTFQNGKLIDWRVVSKAPGDIHTSPQPVGTGQDRVLSERVNTLGKKVQRTINSTGNIVEYTLDVTGTVLNDTTVGRLLDLPVIYQTTNAAGQAVKLVHDTTGAVIQCTVDNTGRIIDSRVVSKPPGASERR